VGNGRSPSPFALIPTGTSFAVAGMTIADTGNGRSYASVAHIPSKTSSVSTAACHVSGNEMGRWLRGKAI